MKEFEFINNIKNQLKINNIELSIGDDTACFEDILIAKDIMIEDVHFTLKAPIEKIIFKLFTANVSDIAAMGGKSENILLGIAIPRNRIDYTQLVNAIKKAASYYNLNLIGGDTTSSPDKLFLSLTITGKKGKNLLKRNGAKPNDIVCISRPLGLSALSLIQEIEEVDFGITPCFHYDVKAEQKLGELLGNLDGITSCIDISDGLSSELNHIAQQSNLSIIINEHLLPVSELKKYSEDTVNLFLQSGEEFALLFTVDEQNFKNIKRMIYEKLSIEIFQIGYTQKGKPEVFLDNGITKILLTPSGYEHKF
jgi:thiamine-monophosphate kinase